MADVDYGALATAAIGLIGSFTQKSTGETHAAPAPAPPPAAPPAPAPAAATAGSGAPSGGFGKIGMIAAVGLGILLLFLILRRRAG